MAPSERSLRQDHIEELYDIRRTRRLSQVAIQQQQEKEELDRKWQKYLDEANITRELNIAWKPNVHYFSWYRVYKLHELIALRIIGHQLISLPERLCTSLKYLTTISLIANELTSLPENIDSLQSVTSIDLTKNCLTRLPEALTKMTQLQYLDVSANKLTKLPENFGSLVNLKKILLEKNQLQYLPTSFGELMATHVILNANCLKELPDSIGNMKNLISLSVNMNSLLKLPDYLTVSKTLKILHASRNKLNSLPQMIGNLQTLQELRLDWNKIRELPFSFLKLNTSLILSMEQNPIKNPPADYVVQGMTKIREYMMKSYDIFQHIYRRELLNKLQQTLKFAAEVSQMETIFIPTTNSHQPQTLKVKGKERGGHSQTDQELDDRKVKWNSLLEIIKANFEPEILRKAGDMEGIPFYAVVFENFYPLVLPALSEIKMIISPEDKSIVFDIEQYPEADILDALTNFVDKFGQASHIDSNVNFRNCMCWVAHLGVKNNPEDQGPDILSNILNACKPTADSKVRRKYECDVSMELAKAGFKCNRTARLIRVRLFTVEEAKDYMAKIYLHQRIALLTRKTKSECETFINSRDGVRHFENLVITLGKETYKKREKLREASFLAVVRLKLQQKKQQKYESKLNTCKLAKEKKESKLRKKISSIENKLDRESDTKIQIKLTKSIEKHQLALQKHLNCISPDGKKITALEHRLHNLDTEGIEMHTSLRKMMEENLATPPPSLQANKNTSTHSSTSSEVSQEVSQAVSDVGDDESLVSMEEISEYSSNEVSEDDPRDILTNVESSSSDASSDDDINVTNISIKPLKFTSQTSIFDINMPDSNIPDYRIAATRAVEVQLDQQLPHAVKNMKNFVSAEPNEETIIDMFHDEIRDQFVKESISRVQLQATYECLVIREVLKRWIGLTNKLVFEAWRDLYLEKRAKREFSEETATKHDRLQADNEAIQQQNDIEEAQYWTEKVDEFSDNIYYENRKTGELTWSQPKIWHLHASQQKTKDKKETVRLPPIT